MSLDREAIAARLAELDELNARLQADRLEAHESFKERATEITEERHHLEGQLSAADRIEGLSEPERVALAQALNQALAESEPKEV